MKTKLSLALVSLAVFLSGCASMQLASEVNTGRQALLVGNNEVALAHFQSAAQKDPNYVYGTTLRQGIWSYVGRTEYSAGKLPEARQDLMRALSQNKDEDLARLFLGLTLAREGDRQQGLKEIEGGMRGIYDWLEYITQTHRYSFGRFWDPANTIRTTITKELAMISGREPDWQHLLANAEWLGKTFEEESDQASRDESRERNRDGERGGDHP